MEGLMAEEMTMMTGRTMTTENTIMDIIMTI